METLAIRRQAINQALKTLHKSIELLKEAESKELHETFRDSVIKRFEYSMDTFWKYLKEYIEVHYQETIEIITPKAVLKSAVILEIISNAEFKNLLLMVDDRNLTSHGYNEEIAEKISSRVSTYYDIMQDVVTRTNSKSKKN